MAKKQFKAESKKLLDLMINSIYTHKEIFLREIISNASDAIDKLYYKCLTEENTGIQRAGFAIRITPDKANGTITVSDNGIGMTKEELETNLGTIARSGSLDFRGGELGKTDKTEEAIDIIGQFGVGFYSAFMVAKKVQVISKKYGEEQAYIWESSGADGYTVKEAEKDGCGTDVILYLKDDTDDEKYSRYLEQYKIRELIRHYSDYIRYPIVMLVEKHRQKEATEEERAKDDFVPQYESYFEDETLNSMVPLWKKNKSEISEEEYNKFYREKFYDTEDPIRVIHTNVEGAVSYSALMYIPKKAPYNYYSREYEKGLALYSSGVLIMEKCADLLPDHFSFVRGLVDSQDLSLNISREVLQHDRQLKAIAQRLEKKIKQELEDLLAKDREKYEEFYKTFGLQLKFGVYDAYGLHSETLKDLIMFHSSSEKKLTTFKEYVSRMKEDQKFIYYACGDTIEKIDSMPQTEMLKDRGYEILYGTDEVDEFALKVLHAYDEKEFKSVADDDLGIEETEEEKKASEKKNEESKEMLSKIKDALGDKVVDVRLSSRLKSHPVCFSTDGSLSVEMEKVLNSTPGEKVKAQKVLEINPDHDVYKALKDADDAKIAEYAKLLYYQALLIEGLPVEDPLEFSNLICKLMK